MEFKNIEEIEKSIESIVLNNKQKAIKELHEIIELLPNEISNLIDFGFRINRIPKEYMLTSILFAFSNAVGLAYELQALGHRNYGNLFFAIVGNRGDMKSLPMKIATSVLNTIDSDTYKEGNSSESENLKQKKFLFSFHLHRLFHQSGSFFWLS